MGDQQKETLLLLMGLAFLAHLVVHLLLIRMVFPRCCSVVSEPASMPYAEAWPYQDCSNSQYPVFGLASCSRPAGQGQKLLPKLLQNWPQNCPVCVAMTARKGRGGGPPGHPPGAQEKLPKHIGFRLLGVTKAAGDPSRGPIKWKTN